MNVIKENFDKAYKEIDTGRQKGYNILSEVKNGGRRNEAAGVGKNSRRDGSRSGDISGRDLNNANRNNSKIADRLADKYSWRISKANSGNSARTERASVRYSKGYHAGDLGKSESLGQQSGDRSTGHFGTGTYFFEEKEKIGKYNSRKGHLAPIEEVEFDNYNLYRPETTDEAYKLHDALKFVDECSGYLDSPYIDPNVVAKARKAVDDLDDQLQRIDGVSYNTTTWELETTPSAQKEINKIGDKLKSLMEKYDGDQEYKKITGYDDFNGEYTDRQLYEMMDYFRDDSSYSWSRAVRGVQRDLQYLDEYADFFGMSRDEFVSELKQLYRETKDIPYFDRYKEDSLATRFMKNRGYEGVDVRHTNLDNSTYGSVIYDLKGEDLARKQEIGTARFSKSKQWERGAEQREKLADARRQGPRTPYEEAVRRLDPNITDKELKAMSIEEMDNYAKSIGKAGDNRTAAYVERTNRENAEEFVRQLSIADSCPLPFRTDPYSSPWAFRTTPT